jgi:hypothetical protein
MAHIVASGGKKCKESLRSLNFFARLVFNRFQVRKVAHWERRRLAGLFV